MPPNSTENAAGTGSSPPGFIKSIVPTPLYTPPGSPTRPAGAEDLLRDLNPAQREAVTHEGGPLLVVAGAGSGKTRVLTRRVAWLVARGAAARSVLAVTFTNKAADVLKERLVGLPGGAEVVAGTFHGFCASVLRRFADRIGGRRDFTILDSDDQHRLLRDLLRDLGIDATASRPSAFAAAISFVKCSGSGRAPALSASRGGEALVARVAAAYAERLRAGALYDFDDLLLEARRVFAEDADALAALRARHRFVLVDEYQDTNAVQSDLLKALGGDGGGVTAVGDPDQSIYAWRGATVRNILKFPDDFPGARVVTLEQNYRSTKRILAVAEAVIEGNAGRYEKRLRTENAEGERAREVVCAHAFEEGDAVVERVRAWRAAGTPWSEMAVLFRANHLTRSVETALRGASVPYAVVSGVEFYQRREVKDVLAYARLAANPRDEAAFLRVVNVPARGIGGRTVECLRARATSLGASVPEAAAGDVPGLARRARGALDRYLAVLSSLRARPRDAAAPVLEAVLDETGYRESLLGLDDPIEKSRVDNVDELLRAAREHDRRDGTGLEAFLERTALVSEQDGLDERVDRVSLMTVHAAKGLEFDAVVVAGVEDDLFPHARSRGSPEDEEEERRLLYVALTRARKRLAVTICLSRDAWGSLSARDPSPFWLDVPDDLVDTMDRRGVFDRAALRRARAAREILGSLGDRASRAAAWPAGGEGEDRVSEGPAEDAVLVRDDDGLPAEGETVSHPFFGRGRLVAKQGRGEDLRVVVDFEGGATKTILWRYARLTRLGAGPAEEAP